MIRNMLGSLVLCAAACAGDSAPAPDGAQTQQIADGTGATVPATLQAYAFAGRMDAPASGSLTFDIFGLHVDARVTCRDDTGQARVLCTPDLTPTADYHLAIDGALDLPMWRGTLAFVADLTVARDGDTHTIAGTAHVDVTSSTLDRTLALDTDVNLSYAPSTNALVGTIALGVDATLAGATTHVEDAMLTLTPAGKLHLRFDGTACFAIDAATGVATSVDVASCE